MKAEIIREHIHEGGIDFVHGGGHEIERILVPSVNNLVIASEGKNLYVFDNFKKSEDCKTVKEIEVPDEFVEKAIAFMKTRKNILEELEKLMKQ